MATIVKPTLGSLRARARRLMHAHGVPTPALDTDVLLSEATGVTRATLMAYPETPVARDSDLLFRRMLKRRCTREPVSRIIGRREFWGFEFAVSDATLDPRPDSETVVDVALELMAEVPAPRILDLGTGSGCLLLVILSQLPDGTGVGSDISPEALSQASANAETLGMGQRAAFFAGSWCSALASDCFDLIVSNPPYIPSPEISGLASEVADHDPRGALDGGADGLDAYRAIVPAARRLLRPGGRLVLEVGAGQAEAVSGLLADHGMVDVFLREDLAGIARCVCAYLAPPAQKYVGNGGASV